MNKDVSNLPGLKIIPLGGIGDVTKNMYVYEYGDDIIIIDCGVGFPDEGMPGIDLVIPDASYLKDKKSKIADKINLAGFDLINKLLLNKPIDITKVKTHRKSKVLKG